MNVTPSDRYPSREYFFIDEGEETHFQEAKRQWTQTGYANTDSFCKSTTLVQCETSVCRVIDSLEKGCLHHRFPPNYSFSGLRSKSYHAVSDKKNASKKKWSFIMKEINSSIITAKYCKRKRHTNQTTFMKIMQDVIVCCCCCLSYR